jgi:hypothetical protein
MWASLENVFRRLEPVTDTVAIRDVVAIRPAHDADLATLHDLAERDSAEPLAGPVFVAVVDGAIWAALALDDGRVIADPFRPAAGAVELLRVRVAQLRATEGRVTRGRAALRGARGARA